MDEDKDDYVERAVSGLVDVLSAEFSCLHPELESRLAEAYHVRDTRNIDPHHITTALRDLTSAGKVDVARERTRGGRTLTTYHLVGGRNQTRIERAARRKRLLYARYAGWSQGTKRNPHGLIGPAGEQAVRGALVDAMQPITPGFGEVSALLGHRVAGSIDTGGYLVTIDSHGRPMTPVTTPIEVKNIRSWIYPSSAELYQILSKCVLAQRTAGPNHPLVPTLVCRRAHPTLFWMAAELGFIVIDARRQWAGDVEEGPLMEVRNELHFIDLHVGSDPSIRVKDRFTSSRLPAHMHAVATKWETTALDEPFSDLILGAHRAKSAPDRLRLVEALRAANRRRGRRGGW